MGRDDKAPGSSRSRRSCVTGCWVLPARGTVVAPAATALLLEALAAVHGLVASRLERYACLTSAGRARRGIHLTRGSVAAVGASRHGRLARRTALRTARGGVHQTPAHVKLLLAGREDKITTALATPKCLIGGQACYLPSGQPAPLASWPMAREHPRLATYPTLGRTLWGELLRGIRPKSEADSFPRQATDERLTVACDPLSHTNGGYLASAASIP